MVHLNVSTGLMDFEGTPFSKGVLSAVGSNFHVRSDRGAWSSESPGNIVMQTDEILFRVSITENMFTLAVNNISDRPFHLDEMILTFPPALLASKWLEYIHAFNMGQSCCVKTVGLPSAKVLPNPDSHMVYVLRNVETKKTFLWGALPPHAGDFVHFRAVHDQPHMEGRFGLEIRSEHKCTLLPEQTASMSRVLILHGEDPWDLLCEYGNRYVRDGAEYRQGHSRQLGWNSWDFFAGAVDEDDIILHSNATKELIETPWIVIDEGWERRWGQWDVNWKFPAGLKGLAEQIRLKGARPGIWTAPLLVNQHTKLFREHEDWFARDAQGQIAEQLYAYGSMSFLDPTIEVVRDWLTGVYQRLRQAGFDYFKVDFTQEILKADRFADTTVPRGQLIRLAFKTIRSAIGPDAYLLACGAPYESVTNLVDAVRTANDIHIHFSHVRTNAKNFLLQSWMQGRLWNTDPDYLVIRCPEICSCVPLERPMPLTPMNLTDDWRTGRIFSLEEARTYALLIVASGGDVILSDSLPDLTTEGTAILRTVLDSLLDEPAQPLDFMTRHDSLPRLLLGRQGHRRLLVVLNLEETPNCMNISPGELGLTGEPKDFWTNKTIPLTNDKLYISLPRRSAFGYWF